MRRQIWGNLILIFLSILITLVVAGVLITGLLQIGQMQVIEKIEQKILVQPAHSLSFPFYFQDEIMLSRIAETVI